MISCTKHYGHNNDTTQQYKSVSMYKKKYLTKKNKFWVLLKYEKEALQEFCISWLIDLLMWYSSCKWTKLLNICILYIYSKWWEGNFLLRWAYTEQLCSHSLLDIIY